MITIREMDDDYILDACPLSDPIDPSCSCGADPGSQGHSRETRRRFFKEVRDLHGNCVLFAWDGDKIVGFLMFLPHPVARKLGFKPLPDNDQADKTLVYTCMQMAPGYRGKGIATQLVTEFIAWARRNDWRAIQVYGVGQGDDDEHWHWGWALPKWQKLGFHVVREEPSMVVALDLTDSAVETLPVPDESRG